MISRRKALRAAATAGIAGISMPAIVGAQDKPMLRWRMASSFPKSLDTIYGASETLANRVAQVTAGRFQIRTFAAGEIVPALQVLDAVQAGTVECGHTGSYYYLGKNPSFAFDTALPFGLNARQQNAWMQYGGGRQFMDELFADYNVYSIPAGNTGAQMAGWFRKEVKSLADLDGLKFRIGGFGGRVLAKLGVVPQQIAAGDIYPALEKGAIDAAEWVGPYDDEKFAFHRVAKYYYYPGFWEGCAQISFLVSKPAYDALPEDYKAALQMACAEANVAMIAKYDAQNPAALRRLLEGGAQLRRFPRDVMAASAKAAFALYDETAAQNPRFARIYKSWKGFLDQEHLWFRLAEGGFDTFVQGGFGK